MVTDWLGQPLETLRHAVVEGLARTRIRPNVLTLCGLATSLVAALFASAGAFVSAGLLLLGAGIFDALDGAIARRTNQSSPFGAFLDSVMDRYADLTVLLGLMLHFAAAWGERSAGGFPGIPWGNPALVFAAGAVLGSALTPYARARAESLVAECKVGIAERPERLVILVIGLLSGRVVPALAVLAVLANVTVLQRLFYVRRTLGGGGPLTPMEHLLYWTYPRASVPFDLLCLLVLVVILAF
ncbi:MAG TPA: CDP-alcohol phosphatidyltransferase family protein [Thermodesulfobacteriota bacterium]